MLEQILEHLKKEEIIKIKSKTIHLGIFAPPFDAYILNGQKTIESRFTKNKVLPYQKVKEDDIVFMKKSSGPIIAYFTVKKVLFFDLSKAQTLDDVVNETLKEKYNQELCVNEEFWLQKANSRYATLIWVKDLVLVKPFKISKKGMQTWLVLKK